MATNFKFLVDWDNDGDFDDTGEDITNDVIDANWSIGFGEPYQHVAGETRLILSLRNIDQKYSPENSSSILYGDMVPQRVVRIVHDDGDETSLYNGYIESINPSPGDKQGDLRCTIVGVGVKQFLELQEYYSPFWEDVTADEVISDILLNTTLPVTFGKYVIINIPGHNLIDTHWISAESALGDLEVGETTFDYVGDTWEDGVTAIDAINDLVQSERGWFYNDRAGDVVFWNRHHILLNDSVLGTVDNSWAEMEYRYDMIDIKNVVRVTNYPRTISSGTADVLYALDQNKSIPPGGTVTFRARYADQDSSVIVSGRNVTTPNLVDGSLVLDPVGADYTLTVVESDARSMRLEISSNQNKEFEVTTLIIKGQKVTAYNKEQYEALDENSIALYGRHVMDLNYRLLDNDAFAQAIANYELAQRKDPRGVVRTLTLKPRSSTQIDMMVDLTIGDSIRVIDNQVSHDNAYIIMGEQHKWRTGDFHEVTWVLQRSDNFEYIIIDEPGKNEIDSGRYIAV